MQGSNDNQNYDPQNESLEGTRLMTENILILYTTSDNKLKHQFLICESLIDIAKKREEFNHQKLKKSHDLRQAKILQGF